MVGENQKIDVDIIDVAHGGYCVARHGKIVVFVTGAAPGESVRVQLTHQRAKAWYATVTEVLRPCPDRVDHIWAWAKDHDIGGADLGHITLEASRDWKAQVLSTQLRRIAHLDRVVEVKAAPSDQMRKGRGWRTRVSLVSDDQGRLSMYQAKSRQLHPIDSMPLAHEEIQEQVTMDIAARVPPGQTRTYVRASRSGLAVHVRGSQQADPVVEVVSTGAGQWTYRVAVDGFWQVHRDAPGILVEEVLGSLGDFPGPVFDLYAGAGLFSLPLGERFPGGVTAIEGSRSAHAYLKENTAQVGVRALLGDVTEVLSRIESPSPSVVIADPPRSGVGRAGVKAIAAQRPGRVVLVSCDPAALARDVGLFIEAGFSLGSLKGFDLFPVTHHVETVAILDRD